MAGVFDHDELALPYSGGDLFVSAESAPGILAAAQYHRRTVDLCQKRRCIGAFEQRLDLRCKSIRRFPGEHVENRIQERGIGQAIRMDHVLDPHFAHRSSSFRASDVEQCVSLCRFRLSRSAGRSRPIGGIHESHPFDTIGSASENFQRDSSSHRMTRDREPFGRAFKDGFRHFAEFVDRTVVGDRNRGGGGFELTRLMRPHGGVAHKAWNKNHVMLRHYIVKDIQKLRLAWGERICRCGL